MSSMETTRASVSKKKRGRPPVSAALWKYGLVSCRTMKLSGARTADIALTTREPVLV